MKRYYLVQTEQPLKVLLAEETRGLMRIGKQYIANLNYVYNANLTKQCLILSDMKYFTIQLPISKDALIKMKELLIMAKI